MRIREEALHVPVEHELGRALLVERDLRRHRTFGADPPENCLEGPQRSSYRIGYRGRLVAAMHHAVGALLVVAGAVAVPVRLFHEFLEAGSVSLAQQIAGSLPAEDIARGIAPGRASVLLVAGEEVEKHRGLAETPLLALAKAEHLTEQCLGFLT